MAKVMIDIPDRYIDAAKGLMLMQAAESYPLVQDRITKRNNELNEL